MQLLGISGSLREGSYNSALLRAAIRFAPDHQFSVANIGTLPLFSQDSENPLPESVKALKDAIRAADAVVFATPEHNRSIPGVLKNAIDWSTRPEGDNPWEGKPVLVIGATTGLLGTATAQYDLKRMLSYLGAHPMGRPEFFCTFAADKFKDNELTDEATMGRLKETLETFLHGLPS